MQWIDRSHATQNHRCVEQRIDPTQAADEMVTENANPQSDGDKNECEQSMPGHPASEPRATQQRMVSTFVHRTSIATGLRAAGSYLQPAGLDRCDRFPDIREALRLFFLLTRATEPAASAARLQFLIDRTMKMLSLDSATKL